MQIAKTKNQIQTIIDLVGYDKPTWKVRLLEKGDGFLVQYTFMEKDLTSSSSELEEQHCRKWYVSPYMTESEIVTTLYKAIVAAEMHEVNERFTYKGSRIFDPHMNLSALAHNVHLIGNDNRDI